MPNWITTKIKQSKYRLTPQREKITKIINSSKGIFCAGEIIKKAKQIDRVSIYRTLELLEKLNLIQPVINLDGEQFYEKNNEEKHHHHIICKQCHKTECIDCTEPKLKKTNFKNINHLLIFTGICNSCNK